MVQVVSSLPRQQFLIFLPPQTNSLSLQQERQNRLKTLWQKKFLNQKHSTSTTLGSNWWRKPQSVTMVIVRKLLQSWVSATAHSIAESDNTDQTKINQQIQKGLPSYKTMKIGKKFTSIRPLTWGVTAICLLLLAACSVSYKFNGASIDYSKVRTIQIADFPIRSTYVWGPMGPMFNNQLKDVFANHTRLQQVKRNGDMKIEGEITQYQQRNKSVSSEGYSAQTELSITVNVRFTNNTNHSQDFERQFTATSSYETVRSLNSVQEELVTQMVKDLTDQIFNATVANWQPFHISILISLTIILITPHNCLSSYGYSQSY